MNSLSDSPRVLQINTSPGGVPKLARRSVEIGVFGVSGDQQANTDLHGGPLRAVSLYSLERILALQAEGHPIFPGAIGENLTLAGVDWEAMQPGIQLRLGEVLLELTVFITPCSKLEAFFIEGDFSRVSQKLHPGWSRLAGKVLQAGVVTAGDRIAFLSG
jgi:MOSC domain-containing protein YiiM